MPSSSAAPLILLAAILTASVRGAENVSLEIDLYSGEKNPVILLVNEKDINQIQKLLELTTDRIKDPERVGQLGYRGLRLTFENRTVRIYKEGVIAQTIAGQTAYFRDSQNLELELIHLALRLNPAALQESEKRVLQNRAEELNPKPKK